MLEPTVLDRLTTSNVNDLTSGRIYPIKAKQNSQLDTVIFSASMNKSESGLQGPVGEYVYTLIVQAWGVDFHPIMDIMDAVRTRLDGWSDTNVKYCEATGAGAIESDFGYGYEMEFSVRAKV